MQVLGIDVGGSGIKGAIVDTEKGELITERHRIETPKPATPKAVAATIAKITDHFDWDHGPIGCGIPAVVQHGVTLTASNIDKSFIGANVEGFISEATGCKVSCLNDADAAGLAEMEFGAGQDHDGVVAIITIGTGIGSAVFTNGVLLPNTEFGHIEINGVVAETRASDAARKRDDLTWKKWAKRFDEYLSRIERLFYPDLIVLGGGASKKLEKFQEYLTIKTELQAAQLLNEAGIIGAAVSAKHLL